MKEIGSIYPLYEISCNKYNEDFRKPNYVFYALCREALYEIASYYKKQNIKQVLIPAYTCRVVIESFERAGLEPVFYNINRNLRIDTNNLIDSYEEKRPGIIVAHPFYGMDFNKKEEEALRYLKSRGCIIIVDLTQNIFTDKRYPFVDYYVGSLRKWIPIPDGGFLEVCSNQYSMNTDKYSEYEEFYIKQREAMYLRGRYFRTFDESLKKESIRLNKEAVALKAISPHKISNFSRNIISNYDNISSSQIRIQNYHVLFNCLKNTHRIECVNNNISNLTTAPLYFPLFVDDRKSLQMHLAKGGIYCPILWEREDDRVIVSEDVEYIYNHILAIPLDQRYDQEDMERIVEEIKKWNA